MYEVFQHQLNKIPFLKKDDFAILFDSARLKLVFIPNFILNDPMTRLYDGVKVYSLDEGLEFYKENICPHLYLWAREDDHYDMIYSVEDLDKVTTKYIYINRYKVKVQTGLGKKEYFWKNDSYIQINKKHEWDLCGYRDLMHSFNFRNQMNVNTLIWRLFEIKDQVCFDYVLHHIKSNTGLNLTRNLCDYDVLHMFLESFLRSEHFNHHPISEMGKNQIYSWFNLLVEYKNICLNRELFETLLHSAWVLRRADNSWEAMLKILTHCKIRHKVLTNTSGYIVEIFDWEGNPLFHFRSDNIRCWYRNATHQINNFLWIRDTLWKLCQTRPNETQELFDAPVA